LVKTVWPPSHADDILYGQTGSQRADISGGWIVSDGVGVWRAIRLAPDQKSQARASFVTLTEAELHPSLLAQELINASVILARAF
jgi:hypothetical protein